MLTLALNNIKGLCTIQTFLSFTRSLHLVLLIHVIRNPSKEGLGSENAGMLRAHRRVTADCSRVST